MSTIADFSPKKSAGRISIVPSILIRQVVADVRWVMRRPELFVTDMGEWWKANGRCAVCCAGAMVVRRLAPVNEKIRNSSMTDFGCVTKRQLLCLVAVNELRCGSVRSFLDVLHAAGHKWEDRMSFQYDEVVWAYNGEGCLKPKELSPDELVLWCRHALRLATQLEAAGH